MNPTTRCNACGVLTSLDYYDDLGWLCFTCYEEQKEIEKNGEETETGLNALSPDILDSF